MDLLKEMIQETFGFCLDIQEVCRVYAEIRMETEKQMEFMIEQLQKSENSNK